MDKFFKIFIIATIAICISFFTQAANDKYRLMWRSDPASSIVIGWNQISGSNPVVYYGTSDYGTNWSAYAGKKTPDRVVVEKGMNNHFARLSNLKPNTAYYFVIKDSDGTSKRFWFKTMPDVKTERLSIIAGGDSRNNRVPRQNANKLVRKLRPHVVLFGGDFTDKGYNTEWMEWFDDWQLTIGHDGRMIPLVAARGNHESTNATLVNLFDVPSAAVYYAHTVGGGLLRIYTLNTEISIAGDQTTWLTNDLANNGHVTWKTVQYHKPMRPHVASKPEGTYQYNNWASLFYQHQVKLVVECDAHTVKTTWPVKPSTASGHVEGFVRDDKWGTVYTGEGCWGAPLKPNDDNKSWTRNSGMFNQINWIFVDQSKIEVRKIKTHNADNVGTVSNGSIFTAPANLDIWHPSNGSVVTIYPSSASGNRTISSRINKGYDDVEENQNGGIYTNSSDMELVSDGVNVGNQTVGLRFTNLGIPKGAVINHAYIQFTTDETGTTPTYLTIRGENADNSLPFTTAAYNVSSRSKTSASVSWSPAGWSVIGEKGSNQRTPDLKSIIQQIVNRNGWSTTGALTLIITGSGKRTAEAYEGSATNAPVLVVEYTISSANARYTNMEEEPHSTVREESILLNPNPFSDVLQVTFDSKLMGKKAMIQFLDQQGKPHLSISETIHGNRIDIDTRQLNRGFYIFTLTVEGKNFVKKVVKE